MPVESPTVAKAETTSNRILIKLKPGSLKEMQVVITTTLIIEDTTTDSAFSTRATGICL
jgi:hypothetical protein